MHRWMVLLPLPETSTTSSCSTDTQTFEGERTRWVESGRTHTQSYSADQNKKFAFCATACNSHTRALSLVVHIEQLALLHSALVQCKHLCACTESLPIDSPIVDGRTHHAITFHFGVTHRNRILACFHACHPSHNCVPHQQLGAADIHTYHRLRRVNADHHSSLMLHVGHKHD
jgi:hypothetical protein